MNKKLLYVLIVLMSVLLANCSKKDDPLNQDDNQSNIAVTDVDGNGYHSVTIGTQTWLVENLKTTKYNDGKSIPNITDNTKWSNLTTGAYCWYNNDAVTYKSQYGAMYNWYAVSTGKLAPKGWHVPTDAEWTTLKTYMSTNFGTSGSAAKALAATTGWTNYTKVGTVGCDLTKNNSSGFTALPGSDRDHGEFEELSGSTGYWWSSTEYGNNAWIASISYVSQNLIRNSDGKASGFSVRCIQD